MTFLPSFFVLHKVGNQKRTRKSRQGHFGHQKVAVGKKTAKGRGTCIQLLSTFLLLFVPVFPTQLTLKTLNFGFYLLKLPGSVLKISVYAILFEQEKTHSEYYMFVNILTIGLYQYIQIGADAENTCSH